MTGNRLVGAASSSPDYRCKRDLVTPSGRAVFDQRSHLCLNLVAGAVRAVGDGGADHRARPDRRPSRAGQCRQGRHQRQRDRRRCGARAHPGADRGGLVGPLARRARAAAPIPVVRRAGKLRRPVHPDAFRAGRQRAALRAGVPAPAILVELGGRPLCGSDSGRGTGRGAAESERLDERSHDPRHHPRQCAAAAALPAGSHVADRDRLRRA